MTRPVPDLFYTFVKRVEGRPPAIYLDSGKPPVPTGGWGHTDVGNLKVGDPVSLSLALKWLRQDASTAATRLASVVDQDVIDSLPENRYAALLSFVFNLGVNKSWTIWKKLNARDLDAVPGQLARFVYDGKVKVDGLVNRRQHEIDLWNLIAKPTSADPLKLTADAVEASREVPSSLRTRETPPEPEPAKPLAQASLATKVITVTAAAGAGATQVKDLVAPHMDLSPIFRNVVVFLTVIIIVSSAVGLFIHARQEKARKV